MSVDYDWGVPADVLKDKSEIFDLPEQVALRRMEEGFTVEPEPAEFGEPGQAKAAIEAEAVEGGITFDFDGETYTIPPMDDWDLDLYDAMDANLGFRIPKLLLTTQQLERFKSEPDPDNPGRRRRKRRTPKDAEALFTAALSAIGTNRGE